MIKHAAYERVLKQKVLFAERPGLFRALPAASMIPGRGSQIKEMPVRYAHFHFCFPHLVRASSPHLLQTKMPRLKGGDIS